MARIRYKPTRRGMLNILGSEQMRAHLHGRAERMAVVAQAEYDARPPHQGEVNVIEVQKRIVGCPVRIYLQ